MAKVYVKKKEEEVKNYEMELADAAGVVRLYINGIQVAYFITNEDGQLEFHPYSAFRDVNCADAGLPASIITGV